MSYEQYWYGDVWAIVAYREADRIRQERTNVDAWLQGMYVYDALLRASPLLHAFAKKGTKPKPYPTKPYDFKNKNASDIDDEQTKENERLKSILFFRNWSKAVQRKFDDK